MVLRYSFVSLRRGAPGVRMAGCPSGQWERTVNPSEYSFAGSNPAPATLERTAPHRSLCGAVRVRVRRRSVTARLALRTLAVGIGLLQCGRAPRAGRPLPVPVLFVG